MDYAVLLSTNDMNEKLAANVLKIDSDFIEECLLNRDGVRRFEYQKLFGGPRYGYPEPKYKDYGRFTTTTAMINWLGERVFTDTPDFPAWYTAEKRRWRSEKLFGVKLRKILMVEYGTGENTQQVFDKIAGFVLDSIPRISRVKPVSEVYLRSCVKKALIHCVCGDTGTDGD